MLASLGCACVLCQVLQGFPIAELPALLVFGYQCPDPAIAGMLNGGGIVSMLNLTAIICISSTYSILFQKSGLLNGVCTMIKHVANRYTPFVGVLLTSLVSNCMACNQTLSIMLTDQICLPTERSGNALALDLENSTVVMAGLVPWSLSSIAVLSFIGVPPHEHRRRLLPLSAPALDASPLRGDPQKASTAGAEVLTGFRSLLR